jgi:hypothetical protein
MGGGGGGVHRLLATAAGHCLCTGLFCLGYNRALNTGDLDDDDAWSEREWGGEKPSSDGCRGRRAVRAGGSVLWKKGRGKKVVSGWWVGGMNFGGRQKRVSHARHCRTQRTKKKAVRQGGGLWERAACGRRETLIAVQSKPPNPALQTAPTVTANTKAQALPAVSLPHFL